jgi:predicted O-methyltransferase YrrM
MTLTTVLLLCTLTLILVMGGLSYLLYQRLSGASERVRAQIKSSCDNAITQIEALLALQSELRLAHALPPTRGWAASPDFLRNLMQHALRNRPAVTVECSSGSSTVVLARCAQLAGQGHVYSLEQDPVFAAKTRELLQDNGLADWATVIDAPLQALQLPGWQGNWYASQHLPEDLAIDLLVIDGPPWFVHEDPRYPALPVLDGRVRKGGVLFLDDAARPEEQRAIKRWLAELPHWKEIQVPRCEKGCVALQKG